MNNILGEGRINIEDVGKATEDAERREYWETDIDQFEV